MFNIHPNNCKSLTNNKYSFADLLSLTGIFGIQTFEELQNDSNFKYYIQIDEGDISIEISTSYISLLKIILRTDKGIITNVKFRSTKMRNGIALLRVKSQVENAKKFKYRKITVWAFGNKKTIENWNGYLVWGKYGFIITDPDNIEEFKQKMLELGRKDEDLGDLVSTTEGTEIWKEIGDEWVGEFILDDQSRSMQILNKRIK